MFFKVLLKPADKNDSHQPFITLSLLVLLIAFIGGLGGLFYFGHQLDLYAKQQEISKLQYALSKHEKHLRKTAADYAVWNDMVERGILNPSSEFYKDNFVASDLYESFHINEAILLDRHLHPLLCSNLEGVDFQSAQMPHDNIESCYAHYPPSLISALPALFKQGAADNPARTTYLLDKKRQVHLLSISEVKPFHPDPLPNQVYGYLLFFSPLDTKIIHELGNGLDLNQLTLTTSADNDDERAALPLLNQLTHKPVAWLTWLPHTPGSQFVANLLPVPLIFITLVLIIIYLASLKLGKSQEKIKSKSIEIKELRDYDNLTGLLKREILQAQFKQRASEHPSAKMAWLIFDIANFKQINGVYGYDTGDEILKAIAKRLKLNCPEHCSPCRYGADQFAVLFHHWQDLEAFQLEVLELFNELKRPIEVGDARLSLEFHTGLALYPDDGKDVKTLLSSAEMALTHSKAIHNTHDIEVFNGKVKQQINRKLQLTEALKSAIDNNELYLVYQPFVEPGEQGPIVRGAEVLLRWRSAEYGEIYPDEFIPLAEQSHQITGMEFWVLETALANLNALKGQYGKQFHLSINLSAMTLQSHELVPHLKNLALAYQYDPKEVHLEMTERILINKKSQEGILAELHSLGYLISLDDFGTGYSSLNYLTQFNLDILKIDKSFIDKILAKNPADMAILNAILQVARALKMEVIAEGVEEEVQVNYLVERDVHLIQGYFYSRPVTFDAFIQELPDKLNVS